MSVSETLRADQNEAVETLLSLGGRGLLLNEPRLGKTRCALALAEQLQSQRILLLGLDVHFDSWAWELAKLKEAGHSFWLPLTRLSSGRTVVSRAAELEAIRKSGNPAMVSINYEAWWRPALRNAIKKWQPDLIIYDEAHRLCDRGGRSSRFAHRIAAHEPWAKAIVCMTATWQEGGFEDTFGIMRACRPEVFGTDWEAFLARYCISASHRCMACKEYLVYGRFKAGLSCQGAVHRGPVKPIDYPKIISYNHEEELLAKIRANSYRVTQDIVGIPKAENYVVPVQLKPKTMRQYKRFMQNYVETFESQLNSSNMKLVVEAKLTLLIKARELANGWVYGPNQELLEISREKLDAARELVLNEVKVGNPVCVWTTFNPDIIRLAREFDIPLTRTWSTLSSTNKAEQRAYREETYREFHAGNVPILIGLDELAKESLDFSPARLAVFYSLDPSLIKFTQLIGRLQKKGHYPEHAILVATDTVDEDIYAGIEQKQDLASRVWPDPRRLLHLIDDEWSEWIHNG